MTRSNHQNQYGHWSQWRPLPDPRVGGRFLAPGTCGLLEIRNVLSGEFIALVTSHNLARRAAILLPPWISGGLMHGGEEVKPTAFSHYLGDALGALEYRTRPAQSPEEAEGAAGSLRAARNYRFLEGADGHLIENDQTDKST